MDDIQPNAQPNAEPSAILEAERLRSLRKLIREAVQLLVKQIPRERRMRSLQGTARYFRDEVGTRQEEYEYISEYFASCLSENSNPETLRQTFLDLLCIPPGTSAAQEDRTAELYEIPLDEPLDIEVLESRNYLALVDTFDDPERIPVSVEAAIEDWICFELYDSNNEETVRMIREFAHIWNRTTNAHQVQMADIFESIVVPLLPPEIGHDLVQLFYANFPDPIDREYSPVPMDQDRGVPDSIYDLPAWFKPGLLEVPVKPVDRQINFPPGKENDPLWVRANSLNRLCQGLESIRSTLTTINQRYRDVVMQEATAAGSEAPHISGRLAFDSLQEELDNTIIPDQTSVTIRELDSQYNKWSASQTGLEVVKSALFSIERDIRTQENDWRGKPELKLKLAASRYERAKCRLLLRDIMAQCDAEQNRNAAKYRRHEPTVSPAQKQTVKDTCSICMDVLQKVGEPDFPPTVTDPCCKKLLHADCLLDWMFNGLRYGNVTCPLCRANLDADFFTTVLEAKVKTMQVL